MNGQTFSTSRYPKLAEIYHDGRLPDLRGLFIRGVGGNAGEILTKQVDAIRNITGTTAAFYTQADKYTDTGAFTFDNEPNCSQGQNMTERGNGRSKFDASLVVPTANENRPVNMSFQWICLAE